MTSDLPRLVVGHGQCVVFGPPWDGLEAIVTLAERPMMACPQCDWHRDHGEQIFGWRCPFCYVEGSGNRHTVTVPVGTRVEVGWAQWELCAPLSGRRGHTTRVVWHPVATATVAYTPARRAIFGGAQRVDTDEWMVDLTDIEATP